MIQLLRLSCNQSFLFQHHSEFLQFHKDETVGLIGANKLLLTHLLPTKRIEYETIKLHIITLYSVFSDCESTPISVESTQYALKMKSYEA